ncbi:flagellar motor switch phosphatase FliY [Clostridium oryzae]|uniref:Flagellar motor switch protein FliN n=1 Tax=Clostridium oryzae TaxID=1450648 RepID=A0A1V4IM22_9CLOT|nr:flagellar motor switch phosphatase FliY [Clostridium oryzae]OPJ60870.1 flagellar motor switch protein FliN [Clostridium oryzae]
MSNGFLSQEEIDSLLNGGGSAADEPQVQEEIITDIEKDLLGEIGNISMGSASTALSQIINQQVNITTPVVSVTTINELKNTFEVPNIALEIKFTEGIVGKNLLVMRIPDAAVIANLMMGGDGKVQTNEISELEQSAVSEAMNQMMGSAATSMATMLTREVNISPPTSMIWNDNENMQVADIDGDEKIVKVSFKLNIGDLVDSNIMQLLPVETAKKIVGIMMGQDVPDNQPAASKAQSASEPQRTVQAAPQNDYVPPVQEKPIESHPAVEVHRADFQPLGGSKSSGQPRNIDLILDVPLEISVVLGKAKKSIGDILALGTGSLIELDKLAEEPVEILVNGKRVAFGEVVVVDENFGVRITNIISNSDKIKSLGK